MVQWGILINLHLNKCESSDGELAVGLQGSAGPAVVRRPPGHVPAVGVEHLVVRKADQHGADHQSSLPAQYINIQLKCNTSAPKGFNTAK